jgi:hypothetical protein
MKKVFFVLSLLTILMPSCTKETVSASNTPVAGADDHGGHGVAIDASSVPAEVMNAFNAKYASAAGIEWKKLDTGNFKVEFFVDKQKFEVIFSPAGVVQSEKKYY